MANTEGMSDEVMQSLFGNAISNPGQPTGQSYVNKAAARRRRAIEDRMEMSMGDKPAARVIRPSPYNATRRQQQEASQSSDNPQKTPEAAAAPPIMGSIVERTTVSQPQGAPRSSGQSRKRQSKFVQQRQQLQQGTGAKATGFPSVQVPLGTFVKPKKKVQSSSAGRATAIHPGAALGQHASKPNQSTQIAAMREASSKEADALLAQMSPEERMEKARELQATLSPEMASFLKKRAKAKGAGGKTASENSKQTECSPSSDANASTPTGNPSKDNEKQGKSPEGGESLEEKQRLADVLSKIKTFEDLDAAFQAEMGDYTPLQSSEISSELAQQAEKDPFPLACTLLRSTLPRQNLWAAQIVSQRLKQQWESGELCSLTPFNKIKFCSQTPWPYAIMLPASLRCLLDSFISHTNGYVLHTYVLQALYNLLRLRACVDHVVDVDIESAATMLSQPINASAIYQEYFLEDAVPTLPVGSVYESIANVEAVVAGSEGAAAAYKTSSSSKSAQQDGEAFAKDPMWTLLTRMCMIPRLAQLVQRASQTIREKLVPKEAIVAICGILAMMSQRSPGAATAIVHHQTLLKHLMEITLMPRDNSLQPYDPSVAIPAIRLLCVVAQQSRTAAERIPFDEFVPPILAIKPKSAPESNLQKWSVILWRTLLRYSLGLPTIQTMITIATSHMALGEANPHSLTSEFASSFANILQSLQVARRHLARVEDTKDECVIAKDQFDALSKADLWLSSSAQQAIAQLEKAGESQATNIMGASPSSAETMRFHAGQMQFLSAFIRTSSEEVRLSTISKDAESFVSDTWISSCQLVLTAYCKNGLLEQAFGRINGGALVVRFDNLLSSVEDAAGDDLLLEASACAFLCSFASLQIYLIAKIMNSDSGVPDSVATKESLASVVERFGAYLDKCIRESANRTLRQSASKGVNTVSSARRGWLNRACFAIIELLNAAKDFGILNSIGDSGATQMLRKLQFALLGRLERGDEAMAAVIFSQDSSFTAQRTGDSSSLLSSMFFREMCRTSTGRVQLDHSFKLKHGPGITSEEVGAFRLRSLLSDVDLPGQSDGGDILLPIGTVWLWQVLSSPTSTQPKEHVIPEENESETEAVQILISCLNLIVELEEDATSDEVGAYAYGSSIPAGAKVYHLMNICLQPETVMQNELVTVPAGLLLDIYRDKMDESFGLEFAKACVLHSDMGKKKPADVSKDKEMSKDEKFASKLLEGSTGGWRSLGEREMRTVVDFIGEVCDAYIDYGAQYDFFTSCVRILSHPTFPPQVRSQAMRRLGEVLNRISLPGEDDSTSEDCKQRLRALLGTSIAGSFPSLDGSARDAPGFLDAIASTYKKGGSPQTCFGYQFLFDVLVHARHLAICAQPESVGFEGAKKRLQTLNDEFAFVVVDATRRFLESSDHSMMQLVSATIEAAASRGNEKESGRFDWNFSQMIESLKAVA